MTKKPDIQATPMRWIRQRVFNLKRDDFAGVAGVTGSTITKYETGDVDPPLKVMARIRIAAKGRGLDFSGDWFFAEPLDHPSSEAEG